jgi:ADP-ribose pyrophosphatase YjhB (NUDIX family)
MPDKHYVTIKAAIVKEGKLLLQKEVKSSGKTLWDLPGGRIDEGEKIKDGLTRELFEEIGVKPKSISDFPVKLWSVKGGKDGVVALLYKVELESEEFVYSDETDDEIFEAKFLSKEEFLENSPIDFVHKPYIIEYFNELVD